MTVERITSVHNPIVQLLRSLKDKRGRDETGLMLVEGEKMISEALKCGLTPKYPLLAQSNTQAPRLFESACPAVFEVSDNVLKSVSDTVTPSGCACAFTVPKPLSENASNWPDTLVALDGVQDPGNVGTIWRTADAAGFKAIIAGEGCADMTSPKVQRAAMGSGFRLPYANGRDLAGILGDLRDKGYDVIVSSLDGEAFYSRGPIGEKFVLVIGSEARGVSEAVKNKATKRLKLPMRGGAESLNAAVAAGIMMYELTKEL